MIHIELEKLDGKISFDIDQNFRTAILGENGIGKSTILESIARKEATQDWLTVSVPAGLAVLFFSQIEKKEKGISGGEHTRERLEILFAQEADLYVLDEPTNNLDDDNIAWLKEFILKRNISIVFTSHDISFVDDIAEVLFYVDSRTMEKTTEKCSAYLVTRKKRIEREFAIYEENLKKQDQLLNTAEELKRSGEEGSRFWVGTDNDKMIKGTKRNAAGRTGSRGKVMETRALAIDVEEPQNDPLPRVELQCGETQGNLLNVYTKALTGKHVTLSVQGGDKVLISGANGVGKTTLINYIISLIEGVGSLRDGDVFSWDKRCKYVYLSQDWYEKIEDQIIEDYCKEFGLSVQESYWALSFNKIDKKFLKYKFKDLSPGVRIKVMLGILSAKKLDLIIWDEPTNHLDVMTQVILREAFECYEGALIIISHDTTLKTSSVFTEVSLGE